MQFDDDARALLRRYVNDHRAGAAGGLELARRIRDRAPDAATKGACAALLAEVEQDAATLDGFARAEGMRANPAKRAGALVAERVGRLKPNGRVVSTSPLGRVLDFEAMMAAVDAKLSLWLSLRHCPPALGRLDLDELAARARDQHARLRTLHDAAAAAAFGAATVAEVDTAAPVPGG